jgi:hypothetical protein
MRKLVLTGYGREVKMMKYEATIVVRCSRKTKLAVQSWAKSAAMTPGEAVRKTLDAAFDVEEEERKLPPGIARLRPVQRSPRM